MDALTSFFLENLLTPGFAAGILFGAIGMYLGVSRGLVMTPKLASLNVEIATLEGKIDKLQADLTRLTEESEDFFNWRKAREEQALKVTD